LKWKAENRENMKTLGAHPSVFPVKDQPRSDGTDDNSNGLLLRRWLRSSRGVAPKKLR
jgi:hypothetical protein